MTNEHLSLWINCILSSSFLYLNIAEQNDMAIETVNGGAGWPKQRATQYLKEIAQKANELSINLHVLYPAPIASTVQCIRRMIAMDIELSPVIIAAITKTNPETVNTI